MADQKASIRKGYNGIPYPESMVASSLVGEGMGQPLVSMMLQKGLCRLDKLVPLSGLSSSQFAQITNRISGDRLNVEYIRRVLTKLRIDLPPAAAPELSSSDSVISDASSLTTPGIVEASPGATSIDSIKLPELPNTSQKSSLTEHERMLLVLKEFPVAYEQYVKENGGPSLFSASGVGSSSSSRGTNSSSSGGGGGSDSRKPKSAGSKDMAVKQQNDSNVSVLCGATTGFSLWNMVADALGWFGFSSKDPQYDTVDQIVGEFCTSAGALAGSKPLNPLKKKKTKLSAVAIMKDTSNPLFLRPTDWTNQEAAGLHLLDESRRLFRIFSGLTRGEGIPTLNWEFRVTKNRVTVHGAIVDYSPWQAVKSDCIIHADKHRIRRLITDDTRSHHYDDQVAGYKVRADACFT